MVVAPGASPICGYDTNTSTGEQCGVVVTTQRKGVATPLKTHLTQAHGVLIKDGRQGREERGLHIEFKVRLLDMYYAPGG
jgi:hypothetical protein